MKVQHSKRSPTSNVSRRIPMASPILRWPSANCLALICHRALMAGHIEAKHGRTMREITAVSGALSLLTNIVMAWNSDAIPSVINRMPAVQSC